MSKTNVTYETMLGLSNQYAQLNQGLIGILLASKLREFHKNNEARMTTVIKEHQKLVEEFYVVEDGKIKTMPQLSIVGKENQHPQLMFKEGKTEELFSKAMEEFMKKITVLEV